jgi:hypothetical protein
MTRVSELLHLWDRLHQLPLAELHAAGQIH